MRGFGEDSAQPNRRTLHVEILGRGHPLVMLHGWGMHGGLLRSLAEGLAPHHQVYLVDLPGHGKSPYSDSFDLPSVLQEIGGSVPLSADWMGWSLGGLLSLAMAHFAPERVRSLVLVNASPCFVHRPGWPGIEKGALERMAQDLVEDPRATLRRFLSLQTFGYPDAKGMSHKMATQLASSPSASPEALQGGLKLLLDTDLREILPSVRQPMLWVLGGRDRMVPAALAAPLGQGNQAARIHVFPEAAHVPFLTDRDRLLELLSDFYRPFLGVGHD